MNPFLTNLIATLTGANNLQANPDFNDPNSQTYRQPYVSPSFWTKMLSPENANYINQSNITGSEEQEKEQQQHDIEKGIKASDFNAVKGASTTPLSNLTGQQGAILFPNVTAPELQQWNETTPRNILGLPSKEATTEYQNESNISRRLAAESVLGQPEASAWEGYTSSLAGGSGNINRNLYNNIMQQYVPAEASAEGIGAQNEYGLRLGEQAALPNKVRQLINESILGAGLSDVDVKNLPTLQNTKQSQIRTAAREGAYPAPPANPLYITPQGTIARNPIYGNLLQTMNAKIGDVNGAPHSNIIPIGNGVNIALPTGNQPSPTNSISSIPTRPVRTPISSVEQTQSVTPTDNSPDYVNNPILLLRDLGKGIANALPQSRPNPPAYWKQLLKDYRTNPEFRKNSNLSEDDLQEKLNEAEKYYANH